MFDMVFSGTATLHKRRGGGSHTFAHIDLAFNYEFRPNSIYFCSKFIFCCIVCYECAMRMYAAIGWLVFGGISNSHAGLLHNVISKLNGRWTYSETH